MNKSETKTEALKRNAEEQLLAQQRQIDYDTKDFTIELLINKFEKNDFFIPDYQRAFVWKTNNRALFIESVLLGLPIPFMFLGDCKNGKVEVIDGAQRLQTLQSFKNGDLVLKGLSRLTNLNGFKFSDLSESQQRKFLNKTLRLIFLAEDTPDSVRQDLFNRINTTGMKATPSEIRRGSHQTKFSGFIEACAQEPLFEELCPIPKNRKARHEDYELVLRFFAYVNSYLNFQHDVSKFLDEFLEKHASLADCSVFETEFKQMLSFVKKNFPHGFAKTASASTTPRVRFEAIAVGTALVLRNNPLLKIDNVDWLDSDDFKKLTTSDASNNREKLIGRIEYVRDQLLASAR